MARKTKADAQLTRHAILDAAEHLFHSQGVSETSLSDIATAAGVSRGAIYWHFKDKLDLFNAMTERVILPMEEMLESNINHDPAGPAAGLRAMTAATLAQLRDSPQVRRVVEITRRRTAYVAEMTPARERLVSSREHFVALTARALSAEAKRKNQPLPLSPEQAAWVVNTQIDGVIDLWLLDPEMFDVVQLGVAAYDLLIRGMGLSGADS